MIDLRKSLRTILTEYGYNVFLQRKDLSIQPQGPYSYRSNHGFKNVLEKYTTRSRTTIDNKLPNVADENLEGVVHNYDIIFYFEHDVNPKEGDRIYVKDDRYKDLERYPGFATYIISSAVAMRGAGGRIEYWITGTKREEPN